MACRVQLASPAAATRPGAVPSRIIGGRLPTSPLTTDSDGPPGSAGNPGGSVQFYGGPPGRCPGSHNWRARAANPARKIARISHWQLTTSSPKDTQVYDLNISLTVLLESELDCGCDYGHVVTCSICSNVYQLDFGHPCHYSNYNP